MFDDRALLLEVEQAAVRGWPALESQDLNGWLWRYTSGGSVRANSVATLSYRGKDWSQAILVCEQLYAARAAPCVFTITGVSAPADLDTQLAARDYGRGDDHVTMVKPVDVAARYPIDTPLSTEPSEAWLAIYLSGLSVDRRGAAPRLIASLGTRPQFIVANDEGQPVSSGMTIVDGAVASVQCMATLTSARRRGGARRVLAAIEATAAERGARHLYLQTGAGNTAARDLYSAFGFRILGHYHTRTSTRI